MELHAETRWIMVWQNTWCASVAGDGVGLDCIFNTKARGVPGKGAGISRGMLIICSNTTQQHEEIVNLKDCVVCCQKKRKTFSEVRVRTLMSKVLNYDMGV